MANKKKAQEIADELGELFQEMIDSMEVGDFYGHFCAELKIIKKWRENNMAGALSDEKIAALERAVEEFRMVYEAEKREAEKMPLSHHEAQRVLKHFKEAEDPFGKPPAAPVEH